MSTSNSLFFFSAKDKGGSDDLTSSRNLIKSYNENINKYDELL